MLVFLMAGSRLSMPNRRQGQECVLSDQHEKTIDHILIQCPKMLQLCWMVILRGIGQPNYFPANKQSFLL
uniref:Reverse transcriptase zinc-binding domain-containing protein n=1 Tax=Oryza barthii TaxID=65489 RepID=A0A0D3G2Y4_9ORYZ